MLVFLLKNIKINKNALNVKEWCQVDIKSIKELAKIMKENNLTVIDIKEGETNLHLERKLPQNKFHGGMPNEGMSLGGMPHGGTTNSSEPINATVYEAPTKNDKLPLAKAVDFNSITEVKSPMVGVFYAIPSPDKDPYVKIGSHVKKGDILCMIEAMKLYNEIIAENDGEIIDICAVNGQVVEFSQVLFKIF